ncbi:MAG TPA: plastocyanin/azurin family copper-binding protein [Nitrososphaera sp.]|jgi:plastocyanin|nr:plastocyanin/azurin family copper-binding protein [Nitrososphaera sp.]
MTDWDLMTPGIGLTSIGIVGVGISLSGIAKTFIDGMHAVTLLTMFIGMIFLASGLLKDGFPTSGRAKSATFITLGFLVTFGFAAAVTVSTQVPSIFAYIGLMLIISIPATVLAVASYRGAQYLKPLAVIFVSAAIVGGSTFYAFGVVTPKPSVPAEEEQEAPPPAAEPAARPANTISARILPGASAEGNPDYDPDPLSVNQGDGVEWTNEDNTPHTVSSKQEGLFDSGIIDAAAKWLLNTADLQPAEYEYYCTLHPFMGATLVVTGSSAANQTAGNTTTAGAAANQMAPNTRAASPLVTSVSIVNGASLPTNEEFYAPDVARITVGSMITWKNDDTTSHTVTSGTVRNNTPTPDGMFDSGILNAGDSFPFLFDKAGEYPYYCTIHPWMTAKVTAS